MTSRPRSFIITDVVHFALEELDRDMPTARRKVIIEALRKHLSDNQQRRIPNI